MSMSENMEGVKAFVKKHWVAIALGVVAIYVFLRYFGGSSSAPAASGNLQASQAALASQWAQASAAQAQQNLAAQTEADQAQIAKQKNQIEYTQAVGQVVQNVGTSIGSVVSAQSQIPIAAMAAATAINQQALSGSAAVAAAGVQGYSSTIDSAAHLLGVQTGNFGTTLIGFGNNLAQETGSALNAVATNSAPAVNAAAASAQTSANANSATAQKGLQVAGMAMMMA